MAIALWCFYKLVILKVFIVGEKNHLQFWIVPNFVINMSFCSVNELFFRFREYSLLKLRIEEVILESVSMVMKAVCQISTFKQLLGRACELNHGYRLVQII